MSQKLNSGGREWASQVPDLHIKICNLGPKAAFFFPKTALEPAENGQMKGNSGYFTHAAPMLPHAKEPSRALQLHNMPANRPQNPQNLCTLAADSPKLKTDHILGYVAQNAVSSAPNQPATTHFWWFPPLKVALTDA